MCSAHRSHTDDNAELLDKLKLQNFYNMHLLSIGESKILICDSEMQAFKMVSPHEGRATENFILHLLRKCVRWIRLEAQVPEERQTNYAPASPSLLIRVAACVA